MPDPCAMVMSKTVWRRHSTRPSLPAGTARKASGHLSGRRPLHLANARPFGRLKAPLGLSLLRCAAQTRACLGRRNKLILQERKTGSSHWGTPCCTYRYRLWLLAGCVREQSSHKTVFAKVPAMGQIWRDFGHAFSFASSSSRGMYPSPSYLIWMCCTRFPLDLSGAST